jgi:hypothetical protein
MHVRAMPNKDYIRAGYIDSSTFIPIILGWNFLPI